MPTNPHPTRGVTLCACGARIRWASGPAPGQRTPVNADPTPMGALACWTDGTGTLRCRVLDQDLPNVEPFEWGALKHFTTCTLPHDKRPKPTGARPARRRPHVQPPLWGQPGGPRRR